METQVRTPQMVFMQPQRLVVPFSRGRTSGTRRTSGSHCGTTSFGSLAGSCKNRTRSTSPTSWARSCCSRLKARPA